MRATFTKLIYILPIMLVFISLDLVAQTQAQLDEIKAYERKIEMNLDNPHFDVETAKSQLKALKQQYGVTTDKSAETSPKNNGSPFTSAESKEKSSTAAKAGLEPSEIQSRSTTNAKMFAIPREVYNTLPAEGKALISKHADNIMIIEQGASVENNVKVVSRLEIDKFLSLPVEKRNYFLNKLEQL